MRISSSGLIVKDFYVVGNPIAPVYMMVGEKIALFDSGNTAFAQIYENDIKSILGDRSPDYLFLTHSHFDHIGSAAYFKALWPELKIVAAQRLGDVLNRPRAVELIRNLNIQVGQLLKEGGVNIYTEPFNPFNIDITAEEGMSIPLGSDLTIEIFHTPGHTWDFMSYWIPEKQILVASEAVGVDNGLGYIYTEFLVNYDAYRDSMLRLAELSPMVVCPGHGLVFTESDAENHINNSLAQSGEYVCKVEDLLSDEDGDINKVVTLVKEWEYDPLPSPKQPEPAYLLNTEARVKTVWQRMQG